MMLLYLAAIFTSLLLLWRAGDVVIAAAMELAIRYRLSLFFVGFVGLALAANLPELAVAVMSALRGVSEVSAGDIVGANFSDIALVTGFTLVLAGSIGIKRQEAHNFLRLIGLAGFVMAIVLFIGRLEPIHGLALLTMYGVFLSWAWGRRHDQAILDSIGDFNAVVPQEPSAEPLWLVWAKCLGALVVVLAASAGAVHAAVELAMALGSSLEGVGATIVAFGTSLPEIALSIAAFRKGNYSLALGPTLGTVFGQATLILGTLTVLSPAAVDLVPLREAAVFMFIAFVIMGWAIVTDRISRGTGIALLSLFVVYIIYHVMPSGVLG